jgi:hypothetical protein
MPYRDRPLSWTIPQVIRAYELRKQGFTLRQIGAQLEPPRSRLGVKCMFDRHPLRGRAHDYTPEGKLLAAQEELRKEIALARREAPRTRPYKVPEGWEDV